VNHLTEEQIVFAYYHELDDLDAIDHLRRCEACQAEVEALARVLTAVDEIPAPEPPAHFAERLWWKLRPELVKRQRLARRSAWRIVAKAAAVILVVGGVFIIGRFSVGPTLDAPETLATGRVPSVDSQARARVLRSAIAQHLGRCERLLTDLSHRVAADPVDLELDREIARQLLPANRLLRLNAREGDEHGLAELLGSVELTLLDLSHTGDRLTASALDELRTMSGADNLIFELRVATSNLEARRDADSDHETTSRVEPRETRRTS